MLKRKKLHTTIIVIIKLINQNVLYFKFENIFEITNMFMGYLGNTF